MSIPSQIITTVAALMNDAAQDEYTNAAVLPYLNLAMQILQETYQLNDIPVTHKTSSTLIVPANTPLIGYTTTPALPPDLIEIESLWESNTTQNKWVPMKRVDFLPNYMRGTSVSLFGIWAWKNQFIEVLPSNAIIDIKMDYVASMFVKVTIATIDQDLLATNITTYLEFQTAALCALFFAENESRAMALNGLAADALQRSLGIPIKQMQSMPIRRRPFRASYKSRRNVI